MKSLSYLIEHILYQIFKITLNISRKKTRHGEKTDNLSIIYVTKIENIITFRKDTGYYLELLTPGTIKLFGSTKGKNKNDANLSHLEVTTVILVYCNKVNNNYQQDSRVLYKFVPNKLFGQLLDISPKYITLKHGVLIKILNHQIEDKTKIDLVIN